MLRSVAWRSLTPVARASYFEIAFCYNGGNNGRIQMSAITLASRLDMGKSSAARALNELQAKGFIEIAKHSSFTLKLKMATEYRLAAFCCDVTNALPSKAFMRWKPEIQNTVLPVGPHGATGGTESQKTARNAPFRPTGGTVNRPNRHFTVPLVGHFYILPREGSTKVESDAAESRRRPFDRLICKKGETEIETR